MRLKFLFLVFLPVLVQAQEVLSPPYVLRCHDFIYEDADFPSCHASTVAELPNGDVIVAWFGGRYEGSPDVCIYAARKCFGEMRWTSPIMLADGVFKDSVQARIAGIEPTDHGRKACYNPVLYQVPSGPLILFYKIGRNVQDWTGWYQLSTDNGYTWSERHPLPQGFLGPIKNKPEMVEQTLLCPSSTEKGGWKIHFETLRLDDDQRKLLPVARQPSPVTAEDGTECIQPSILRLNDGVMQVLCRTQNGRIATSKSYNGGSSWSKVVLTEMPNNNSGLDAVTLRDGRHILVYNPVTNVEGSSSGPRTPLAVAISNDGQKWQHLVTLEDDDEGEYSYPAVIQARDGSIHITYTWHRERICHAQIVLNDAHAVVTP